MSDAIVDKLQLSPGEINSPLWRKLEAHFEQELKNCRGKNDDSKLDATQTAAIRGQIQTLKSLLALGNILPVMRIDG